MKETSSPAGRALGLALILALLVGTLYAIYCMVMFSGPYRWLAELQLRWFDAYYVSTTCALTLVLFVVPPNVLLRVLAVSGKLPPGSWGGRLGSPGVGAAIRERMARGRRWLLMLGVGLALCFLSLRDLVVAARGKSLEVVAAQALEQGRQVRGTWLEIQGTLDWERALETEERSHKLTYVPVISESWQDGRKLGALLVVDEYDLERTEGSPIVGTVDITGLPGMVRAAYEDMGLDVSQALLLEFGESPQNKALVAKVLIALGSILAVIGGIGSFFRMRTPR